MKTLYVSDLDGTLLRKNETLSPYTIKTINALTSSGMLFSYATARSLNTAKKVTEGLNTHFPLIIYNGAFVKIISQRKSSLPIILRRTYMRY